MKKCLFQIDTYVVSCPTSTQNLKRYLFYVQQHSGFSCCRVAVFCWDFTAPFSCSWNNPKNKRDLTNSALLRSSNKTFHFASVSVWPGGRNWGNKMRIWRLFADPELFGSPQCCRIQKCAFDFNGSNSFKCSLLRLLFNESDNEFRIYLMRVSMNVCNNQIALTKKVTDKEKRIGTDC